MTRDEGQACWDVLSRKEGEPDARSWGEQFVEYTRLLKNGTPVEQAERLHRLYRVRAPLPPTHVLMVTRFEEHLLHDVAKALGKSFASAKSVLHREQPAFAGEAPQRPKEALPPKPASLAAWDGAGGFFVYGSALVLGESPRSGKDNEAAGGDGYFTLSRPALNGAWLLLNRPQTLAEEGDTFEGTLWVAVHVDHAENTEALLAQAKELGAVFVEGGTSAAVDAEVRDDPWFLRNFEAGDLQQRGFVIELGGDGLCAWRGAFAGEQLCLIAADGMWE